MKKALFIAVFSFLILSCSHKVERADIAKINGYWEIETVVFPDGNHKQYGANDTYDYFEVKDNKGFRKKVMPQLDGTFLVNDTFETVAVKDSMGQYYIHYSTSFSKWKEQILALTEDELVLQNSSKKEYHYKRAAPINIINHGKKAQ